MRIYVASSFSRKEDVRAAHRTLMEDGHSITHDWTQEDTAGKEGQDLKEYLQKAAYDDWNGVQSCDAIVLLNDSRGFGAMVELGMAMAYNKRIVVIAPEARDCIFFGCGEVETYVDVATASRHLLPAADLDEDVEPLSDDWEPPVPSIFKEDE